MRASGPVRAAFHTLMETGLTTAQRVVDAREDDPEALHDFRVALRRLRSILRAARTLYDEELLAPVRRAAKEFGDATSALRDAEVLAETVELADPDGEISEIAGRWLAQVRAREQSLRSEVVVRLASSSLPEVFAQLEKDLAAGPVRDLSLAAFAHLTYARGVDGVKALLPIDPEDGPTLHRLRIRFKRLRYGCELLTRLTGETAYEDAVAHAKSLQTALGLLHDADQALLMLQSADLSEADRVQIESRLRGLRDRLTHAAVEELEAVPQTIVGNNPVRRRGRAEAAVEPSPGRAPGDEDGS